jgi:hypothetical protein
MEEEVKKKPGEDFRRELDKLVKSVEQRVTREVTDYFLEYIDTRLIELSKEKESTEYDYCERLGRIKELQELTKTLRNLN